MEINNWVEFFQYSIFTLGVVFVLFPMGVNFTYAGIKYFKKYKFSKFPNSMDKSFGEYPHEMILIGLFALSFSIWYLFFDVDGAGGGNLINFLRESKEFLVK
ncbi:MAG: hypothetical protein Q9O24_05840 [Gammaproteobacteria bacterium]|nr:hypothetical protein [Gammaproteobacteria bacterium]